MTRDSEKATVEDTQGSDRRIKVWDLFVRFFHWSVAIAFFLAYFTEGDLLTIHVWAGYTIGLLVSMRIVWGFVGSPHARFVDFVTGPWKAWRYLRDLLAFRAERHIGHSPVGGVMVLLLLVGLLATVWSGMELHAIENNAGPLAANVKDATNEAALAWPSSTAFVPSAHADEDDRGEGKSDGRTGEGFWEDVHESLANVMLALVILHVLGVVLASVVHRENLAGSMISGSKRVD